MELTLADHETLQAAYRRLETPSLVIRLSSAFGVPVEKIARELGKRAPEPVAEIVSRAARKAIELALEGSARTLRGEDPLPASNAMHMAAAATSGAIGGFFGMQGLIVELPVTTGIMFRSMADIARAEGESPRDPETLVNVLQVFALGSGVSDQDDAAETAYYGARVALGKVVNEAMQHVVKHGMGNSAAPSLVRLTAAIASRFGVVVTQKSMAQAIPVIGAIGGGLVNTVFISHFQEMARAHFAIRRLERTYSPEVVRAAYAGLVGEQSGTDRG